MVSAPEMDLGEIGYLEPMDDGAIDLWNDGALDALRGRQRASADADYAEGYAEGLEARKVRPLMLERPEGYYHQPIEVQ